MIVCQIELMKSKKPYPRTCPTCGLSGACVKGLELVPNRNPATEPVFDANGWCHDMNAAPRDGKPFLVSWPVLKGKSWFIQAATWSFAHDRFVIHWDHDDEVGPFRAWRPLPLPPVKEQDQ